jgi:hypothetical protein
MTTPLDELIDTVRASEARLDDHTRAAVLERVLAEEGEHRFVPAAIVVRPRRRSFAQTLGLVAAGIAVAAAASVVVGIYAFGRTHEREYRYVVRPSIDPPDDRVIVPKPTITVPLVVPPTPPVVGASLPKPAIIPPLSFESYQIAGERNIFPDDVTKAEIARAGTQRIMIPVKVCMDTTGRVDVAELIKGTGFPAYDAKLVAGVLTWRYRPYLVNGTPVPVCSIVQFVYNQR